MMGKLKEDFIILSFLFEDEYGKVYRAFNKEERRKVWIKEIHDYLLNNEKYKRRILEKSEKVKNLRHKNIQRLYDYWEEDGKLFFELENLTGTYLDELIYKPRHLDKFEVISIAYQLFTTLSYAHNQGIIHENVRPDHITIEKNGDIKITNFMMVDPLEVHRLRVRANAVVDERTEFYKFVRFASPWHLDWKELGWESDFFSAAVTVFELATKDTPWDRSSQIMFLATANEPKAVRHIWQIRKDLPPYFSLIISKCLTDYNWTRDDFKDEIFKILQDQYDTFVKPVLEKRKKKEKVKEKVHKLLSFALGTLLTVGLFFFPLQKKNLDGDISIPITVLPVENKTDNPSLTPIAIGMTQEIIDDFLYLNPFSVITIKNMNQLSRLNKNLVLKSEIKGGREIELNSKLLRVKNKETEIIWSSKFNFKDSTSLKFYLSRDIMKALGLDFKDNGSLFFSKKITPEVYNLYLNSIYWHNFFMKEPKKEYLDTSKEFLLKAISLDGNYSPLYSALASNYLLQLEYGFSDNLEIIETAKKFCLKALEIDKNDLRARSVLAFLYIKENKKLDAWRELREIYRKNPKNPIINGAIGTLYQYSGILDQALEKYEKIRKINPLDTVASLNIARIYIFKGEYSKAEKELRNTLRESESPYAISYLGITLSYQGKLEEAIKILENAKNNYPEDKGIPLSLSIVYSREGRYKEAEEILNNIEPFQFSDPDRAYKIATCYSLMNEKDLALKWLRTSIKNGNENYLLFKNDPYLENLRKDIEFQKILEEIEKRWKIYRKKFNL